jgi:hypothetical protein
LRRLTRNRGFLALSFLLLAAGSLWMLLAGSGPERVLGVACLIMFGGGGAAWVIGEFLTPPA